MAINWQALWDELTIEQQYLFTAMYRIDLTTERRERDPRSSSGKPAREWRWMRTDFPSSLKLHIGAISDDEKNAALKVLEQHGYAETRHNQTEARLTTKGRRLLRQTGNVYIIFESELRKARND